MSPTAAKATVISVCSGHDDAEGSITHFKPGFKIVVDAGKEYGLIVISAQQDKNTTLINQSSLGRMILPPRVQAALLKSQKCLRYANIPSSPI